MSTSTDQDQRFIDDVLSRTLLEESINWIADNIIPEEVFPEYKLAEWANDNGYIKEE